MLNLGLIGYSDIANRAVIPAVNNGFTGFKLAGISSNSRYAEARKKYRDILVEEQHENLICHPDIDAYYVSLPPGKHYEVVRKCLEAGKHVYCEKPLTLCSKQADKLFLLADQKELTLVEGYMYFHSNQFAQLEKLIATDIGKIKFIHSSFTIPLSDHTNFRYSKNIGGGGLYDTCGYPLSLILYLLGNQIKIKSLTKCIEPKTKIIESGLVALEGVSCAGSISFGLNSGYSCSVQIVGELGSVYTDRIFTARAGQMCSFQVFGREGLRIQKIIQNDHFEEALNAFHGAITHALPFKGHNPLVMKYLDMIANG